MGPIYYKGHIGVAGCGWPNLARISQKTLASFVLRNNAPTLASVADAAASLRKIRGIAIFLSNLMGSHLYVKLIQKK